MATVINEHVNLEWSDGWYISFPLPLFAVAYAQVQPTEEEMVVVVGFKTKDDASPMAAFENIKKKYPDIQWKMSSGAQAMGLAGYNERDAWTCRLLRQAGQSGVIRIDVPDNDPIYDVVNGSLASDFGLKVAGNANLTQSLSEAISKAKNREVEAATKAALATTEEPLMEPSLEVPIYQDSGNDLEL